MQMLNEMLELVNNFLELAKIVAENPDYFPLLALYRKPESKEEKNKD